MKRIPWNIIRQKIMRLPFLAAEHAFPFTLLLIAIAGICALIVFAYGFSLQTRSMEQGTSVYGVQEELFLDTLGALDERKQGLENVGKEISKDIFNPD